MTNKLWDNPAITRPNPGRGVPASFQIGPLTITPATVLAPMAGVTDTVFRRFIRNTSLSAASDSVAPDNGCGLIMTEFTSADGVLRARDQKAKRYLHFYEDEHPIAAQLFGGDPQVLAEAAKMIEDLGFDVVDLNLGCPARKVVKCTAGSGLLRDLPLIRRIFESVRAAVKIPFTVKFRAGWDEKQVVCVELARLAEACGLQAVALHARTREQGYSGNARWDWIAAVKNAVKVPVIGNGDVRSPEDATAMVAETGCDAVMIGRTAASNPWIFKQIAQYNRSLAENGVGRYDQPSERDRYQMIRTYFRMLIEEELPDAVGKMKQFTAWFTHGVHNGSGLRKAVYEARSQHEILDRVEKFFEQTLQFLPQVRGPLSGANVGASLQQSWARSLT